MLNSSTLYLIGAGPGDPELITVKAVRCLRKADVILYDALVGEELLSYARPGAVLHFAGKRMGCHYLSQQEINHLIVEYGSRYQRVVRLKGGDPFIFGRAQEEMDAARLAGMNIKVVPGVSSATAVPASAGIPLTCRGINESFWVTTGTTKTGEISPDIALASISSATVVILMAMNKLDRIMDVFRQHGKSRTPVAVIQQGTTSRAKSVTGTVEDICFRVQAEGLSNPSIVIVGEVVRLGPGNLSAIPEILGLSASTDGGIFRA